MHVISFLLSFPLFSFSPRHIFASLPLSMGPEKGPPQLDRDIETPAPGKSKKNSPPACIELRQYMHAKLLIPTPGKDTASKDTYSRRVGSQNTFFTKRSSFRKDGSRPPISILSLIMVSTDQRSILAAYRYHIREAQTRIHILRRIDVHGHCK